MAYILMSLLIGVIFGYSFRHTNIKRIVAKTSQPLIWGLLGIMGIELGGNMQIWRNISNVGFVTVVITLCSILGSIAVASLYYYISKH